MPHSVVIFGAGGFGRECLDVIEAMNVAAPEGEIQLAFLGFLDPFPDHALLEARQAPWLGGDDAMQDYVGAGFIVGIGPPGLRQRIAEAAEAAGLVPATLIHPSATFGAIVEVGAGSVICAQVSITTNVRIGRHVHLNPNASVGHDAVLHDYVSVNPSATISGCVVLEDQVTMGTNSTVIQGLRIGRGSVIGAGAAVVRDIPAGVVAVGVPARVKGG